MKKLILLSLSGFALMLTGCKNDTVEDVKSPEIVMEQPLDGEKFAPGDEFHIEIMLTDDVELNSCIVEIMPQGVKSGAQVDESWQYSRTFNCAGMQTTNIHEHVDIPDSINNTAVTPGLYTFSATCTDKAGNHVKETVVFTIQ